MQLPRDRENGPGKAPVFCPALQAGAEPVGMPRPEMTHIDEMDALWHQTLSLGLLQIVPVPGAGEHPQFVIARQASPDPTSSVIASGCSGMSSRPS